LLDTYDLDSRRSRFMSMAKKAVCSKLHHSWTQQLWMPWRSEDYEPDCEPDYYDTPLGLADNTAPTTTGGSHRSDRSNVQSLGSSNHSLPTHVATSKLRRRPPIFCGSCTTLPTTDCAPPESSRSRPAPSFSRWVSPNADLDNEPRFRDQFLGDRLWISISDATTYFKVSSKDMERVGLSPISAAERGQSLAVGPGKKVMAI